QSPTGQGVPSGALWSPLRWTAHFLTDGAEVACHVTASDGGLCVETPLGPVAVHWQDGIGWRFDGAQARPMHFDGKVITLFDLAQTLSVPDPLDRRSDQGPAGDTVSAPMPGLVRDVLVVEGQEVAMGDRLVVMEAMKMEHTLRAPRAGTVAKVAAIAGSQVASGAVLVTLEDAS
ncbi:MAG: biotin/lipoyl-binding protein, partial [Rhodobacteraceae bacterium]|nr:biotin/lipoyl-binding protein [Paracoccaceae bacterium]